MFIVETRWFSSFNSFEIRIVVMARKAAGKAKSSIASSVKPKKAKKRGVSKKKSGGKRRKSGGKKKKGGKKAKKAAASAWSSESFWLSFPEKRSYIYITLPKWIAGVLNHYTLFSHVNSGIFIYSYWWFFTRTYNISAYLPAVFFWLWKSQVSARNAFFIAIANKDYYGKCENGL